MILYPSAKAEEQQIMPLLQPRSEFVKDPASLLGTVPVPEQPTQVKQQVDFLASHGAVLPEQSVNYLLCTGLAASLGIT